MLKNHFARVLIPQPSLGTSDNRRVKNLLAALENVINLSSYKNHRI